MAVVAFLQVDADLGGGLHLELVHSGTCLRDIDLVALVRRSVSPFHQIIYRASGIAKIDCVEKGGVYESLVGKIFVV